MVGGDSVGSVHISRTELLKETSIDNDSIPLFIFSKCAAVCGTSTDSSDSLKQKKKEMSVHGGLVVFSGEHTSSGSS